MSEFSLFDILGPSMIGPSSSHTAGAVRLGLMVRCVAGQPITSVTFHLYNSFSKTYKGHGSDRGLLAGILGISVSDERIREAESLAQQAKIDYRFVPEGDDLHLPPNTVRFEMGLENGESLSVLGHSIGGGKVLISKINTFNVSLKGDYPTLVMFYADQPGMIWQVTKEIAEAGINIATLMCSRRDKGDQAFMAIALDSLLPADRVAAIAKIPGVAYVRNVDQLPK
jgi:L-serine dehydratase